MDESFLSTAIKLAIVEVLDRDGHSRATVPVWRWPVTLGRAVDCDVVLDDEHTAALHATVTEAEGTLRLRVGETVNGVRLGGRRLAAHESAELSSAAVFQIGATRLRVRRLSDALAPERPLAPEPAPGRIPIAVLAPAFVAWNLGDHWVNTDPGQRFTEYLPPLLGPLLLVAIWSGLWAVGSKLVTHRFHYWRHARIAFSYSLAASFVGVLLPIVAFSSGWSFPSRVSGLAMAAVAAAVIWAHLSVILPSRRRPLAIGVATVFTLAVSLYLIRNYQVQDRVFDELYVTALPPPAFRLAPTITTARFVEETRRLKAVLDAHAAEDEDEIAAVPPGR